MKISTRSIVVAGVLIAISTVLAITGWGYLPVPNLTGKATIMQVPAILGGVLEGPIVGIIVGIPFGLSAWLDPTLQPLFAGQPVWMPFVVLFLPRLFIGVTAAYSYRWLRKVNEIMALTVAGVVGTLTNTVLVLGLAFFFGILPVAILPAVLPQVVVECIIAAILTVAVVASWKRIERGNGGSSV